jgi:hypothetical protein
VPWRLAFRCHLDVTGAQLSCESHGSKHPDASATTNTRDSLHHSFYVYSTGCVWCSNVTVLVCARRISVRWFAKEMEVACKCFLHSSYRTDHALLDGKYSRASRGLQLVTVAR